MLSLTVYLHSPDSRAHDGATQNKKGTSLYLGVDALGLNVYRHDNRLVPQTAFPWSEIRNVSYHDKRFTIKAMDAKASDFAFYVLRCEVNKVSIVHCPHLAPRAKCHSPHPPWHGACVHDTLCDSPAV